MFEKQCINEDVRCELDDNAETVGNKIRKAIGQKVPYMVVVGDKELEDGQVSVRQRGKKEMEVMTKEEFIAKIKKETEEKIILSNKNTHLHGCFYF